MKKIYAVATESDVVLAFESRSDADECAGEHDGMAVLPVPCVGAYEYPSEKSATDWDRIADALPKRRPSIDVRCPKCGMREIWHHLPKGGDRCRWCGHLFEDFTYRKVGPSAKEGAR